jgi:hypothetical protein
MKGAGDGVRRGREEVRGQEDFKVGHTCCYVILLAAPF